jgi:hypothetical protein
MIIEMSLLKMTSRIQSNQISKREKDMTFHNRRNALALSVTAVAILSACGGGGGSGSGQGTLNVSLTDAPACGFDAVNVTVSKVRVHQSGNADTADGNWHEITLNPARKINLLNLTNGVLENLGQTSLPAGRYTQMRLVLANPDPLSNSVVPTATGTETALVTPSGLTSGIKLNGNFEVAEGATTDLTLDFDACKSIVTRGNGTYGLKPVISIIPMAASGAIAGFINPAIAATNKPVVSAQVDGVIIRSTVPAADGTFSLSPINAGNYTIVVTADAHASSVITGVPVTAKATTAIGNSSAPIALSPSAERIVSGTVTPAGAEAEVAATQTFASGPKATIKYQNAETLTGAYLLNLPVAAPMLGQYGSGTLPIGFAAQPALAGQYAINASATTYQSQSVSVDISAADQARNFALVK